MLTNINGMALVKTYNGNIDFLAVIEYFENNNTFSLRKPAIVLITTSAADGTLKCVSLTPTGRGVPFHLEALTSIPNDKTHFLAIAETSEIYLIKYDGDGKSVTVEGEISVGKKSGNFEGLAVQKIGGDKDGVIVAAWAERGANKPATLFWAKFQNGTIDGKTLKTDSIEIQGLVKRGDKGEVRAISDIKITEKGKVYIVSAYDSNDDDNGPFDSAFYLAGEFSIGQDKAINFKKAENNCPILKFDSKTYRKVEALELLPDGSFVFATDDENLKTGGAFFLIWKRP